MRISDWSSDVCSSDLYRDHLIRMGTDAASRGARVVLCTSCERRWFDGDRVTPTHGDYPHAVRDLAAERGWALIDLTAFTTWLYEEAGVDASRRLLSHFTPGEVRSEEHTSELQSLMRSSYAVFC